MVPALTLLFGLVLLGCFALLLRQYRQGKAWVFEARPRVSLTAGRKYYFEIRAGMFVLGPGLGFVFIFGGAFEVLHWSALRWLIVTWAALSAATYLSVILLGFPKLFMPEQLRWSKGIVGRWRGIVPPESFREVSTLPPK